MPITSTEAAKLVTLLIMHRDAAVHASWAGSMTPDDAQAARVDEKESRKALAEYINSLVEKNQP